MTPIKLKTLVESFLLPYKDLEPLGWKKSVKEQLAQAPVAVVPGAPATAPVKTMSADVTKKIEGLTIQTNKINKDVTNLDAKMAPMMKKKADLQKKKADLEKEKTRLSGVQENVNENSNDEMPNWARSIVEKAMNILGGHFDSDSYASTIPAIIIHVVASDLGGFSITPESHINNTERYAPNNMKYKLGLNFTDGTKDRIVKKNLSLAEVFKYVKLYL